MKDRIIVSGAGKKFKRNVKRKGLLRNIISTVSGKMSSKDFWAVKNVSLKVRHGENVGIIGRNGSGKTTLIRMISGIYEKDKGDIMVNGRVVCLSGLSNGLSQRLSVHDNVFMVGLLLGLSRKEVKKNFNKIISFAGLEKFVYSRVDQLSRGMKKRLSFSITIHCLEHINPDILLLDEVFSGGGDEEFKEKSLKKMEELVMGKMSVVLVSHKLNIVEKYCKRVLLMDDGKIIKQGMPKTVINEYLKRVKNK